MLHVHRAADATRLVDDLADVLAVPSGDDPFAAEVVAVPSRGIERWLAQELSRRLGTSSDGRADGVCANVVFPFPAAVVGWGVGGTADAPVDVHQREVPRDPWMPAHLTWSLLDVVEGTTDDGRPLLDTLGAFGAHLAGDRGRARRLPALRHVADLFDRYGVHRPDMVRAWRAGEDVDATGAPLAPTAGWQPRLWRAVRRHLDPIPSFPEQVRDAVARLGDGAPVPGLPRRVSLYGLTGLPATYVEVLEALGVAHDVHVFLLHPSPTLWDRVAPMVDGLPRPLRADDPTAEVPTHPLVASWGRDSRELQVVLAGRGVDDLRDPDPGPLGDDATLLARIQHDLVTDDAPPGAPIGDAPDDRLPLAATADPGDPLRRAVDDSIQVHACHGRLRQVEVLRDAVFGLMSDHPDLQPRDVVVMCPDVEAFAPLVDAVFGADVHVAEVVDPDEATPGLPDVRVRLADRSLRQVNPLLRTMADVLHLPDSRVEATTVLDLAHRGPVRERFRFSDDDLGTIEEWVDDLRVRWGLDADHRVRHGLASDANTWRAGLDRLLLGVAVPEDGPRTVAGLVPHDDVEGSSVDLAGRLAELVDRIGRVVDGLADPRPVTEWCDDLRRAAALLTSAAPDDAWQQVQFDRVVDEVRDAAGGDEAPTVPVTLAEVRALLDDRLRGRPSRANHRTGDLTVCTLVPMRSVPYRVVCLLGLDDETFPRRTVPSGDDLVARAPMVGDRDPRTEDRQLLLDALLAARDHLVVTYRARDERNDALVPPAVPLSELLDVVDATARPADGHGTARDLVVRAHPLRGADPREFDPADPFGFDPVALAGARARTADPVPPRRFLDDLPAAAPRPTVVEWADFVIFLDKPVRGYLRRRLGVSLRNADDPIDELLPVELVALDEWQVGTRLLTGAMAEQLDDWLAAERSRGTLPVDQIGAHRLEEVLADVRAITDAAAGPYGDRLRAKSESVEVDLRVGDLHLVGVVPDVRPDLLGRVDYGRPKPKRLLRLWLPWLAMQAMGRGREAVLVTRGKKPYSKKAKRIELARLSTFPADADRATVTDHLAALADLYVRGHDHPLPVFEEATPEFAVHRLGGADRDAALARAGDRWVSAPPGRTPWGDGLDPSTIQVFGRLELHDLLAIEPHDVESGPGWDVDEPSRFGRLARRIWDPVLTTCHSWGVE